MAWWGSHGPEPYPVPSPSCVQRGASGEQRAPGPPGGKEPRDQRTGCIWRMEEPGAGGPPLGLWSAHGQMSPACGTRLLRIQRGPIPQGDGGDGGAGVRADHSSRTACGKNTAAVGGSVRGQKGGPKQPVGSSDAAYMSTFCGGYPPPPQYWTADAVQRTAYLYSGTGCGKGEA